MTKKAFLAALANRDSFVHLNWSYMLDGGEIDMDNEWVAKVDRALCKSEVFRVIVHDFIKRLLPIIPREDYNNLTLLVDVTPCDPYWNYYAKVSYSILWSDGSAKQNCFYQHVD